MINLSERVVKVRLSAQVAEYQAGMLKAAQATRTVGSEAEKLAQKRQAFEQLGRVTLTAGGLMAAGIGVAVKKFADFDQAMSNVAATGQDARNNINALRDAAIEAGARTVFSATESANAIEEMAKAGVDAKDILGGGLAGALDLAAAGGLGVADAAGIAATALKTFKLEGSDMGHVADLLAAGAGKAMGDVSDLSQALSQGGQVAAATGLSIEETTAALSAFASQGLLGSDAGTSLKTMLQRLTPQSKEAAAQFEELGISAYDANGQFVGLSNFAGQLKASMSELTPEARNAAMSVMFGSDAVRAANVLYDEGWRGIEKWTSAVDDQGYAAETARTKLDNLKGDVEALGGAFDSALITMGSAADGPLRGMVQGLTGLVDKFNELPEGAQQAVLWTGAVASAGSIALGTYLTLVPKVADFKVALDELGPSAQKTASAVGKIAAVGSGVVTGLAAGAVAADLLTEAFQNSGLHGEELANKIATATDATALFDAQNQKTFLGSSNLHFAEEQVRALGTGLDALAEGSSGAGIAAGNAITAAWKLSEDLGELAKTDLPTAQKQFRLLAEAADLTKKQQGLLLDQMAPYKRALTDVATDQGKAADDATLLALALGDSKDSTDEAAKATERNEDALREMRGQADDTRDSVEDLADTIRDFGSATLDVRGSQRDFEAALDDVQASLKKNGTSLDITTEKGRANEAALDGVATSALEYAAALYEQTGSQEKASGAIAEGRERLIQMLEKFGVTGEAAEKYADKLGLVPENISTYVEAVVDPAAQKIDSFISKYSGRRINVYVDANGGKTYQVQGTDVKFNADGGAIVGPGTGTSDSILSWVSNGEHVLTAADVAAMGGQSKVYEFRQALHGGEPLAFASGGAVTLQEAKDAVARAEAKLRKAKTKSKRKDAQDELDDAKADLADVQRSFREDLNEWNTGTRRGENRRAGMTGNGLSLVDQLLDIAAETGGKRGAKQREQALKSEKAYLRLEKAADDAAKKVDTAGEKLQGLKDAAAATASAVANAVKSFFNLSEIGAVKSQTETIEKTRQNKKSMTVDGQTYSWYETESYTEDKTTTTKPTAKSILADTKTAEARIQRFAKKLEALAKKKLSPKLLEEIAMLGVEAGEPIADALLTATASEISQINASYGNIGKFSDQAGTSVADANFKKQIELAEKQLIDAKKNADDIRRQLAVETNRIVYAITNDLKAGAKKATGGRVIGPGSGTSDSIPAWLSNGEHVWTAAEVAAAGGHDAVEAMRRRVLVPTAPQFGFAFGGPVQAAPAPAAAAVAGRPSKEVIQVVLDRRVLAEAIREHDRSLR